MSVDKTRVLMIIEYYPQISQTYIKSEIEAVADQYDVRVISMKPENLTYRDPYPYERTDDPRRMQEIIEEFRPHVLHTHYVHNATVLTPLAQRNGIPFTVRGHSFDTIQKGSKSGPAKSIQKAVRAVNGEYCLGVLTFPFTRPAMEKAGIRSKRIVDCYPVVQYDRFFDRAPNGDGVMNLGACLPKKRMEDFVDLAVEVPDKQFDLYPLGYASETLRQYNTNRGAPINIHDTVEPDDMPAVYKAHGWLVYTGCRELRNVGWPMAVAEAQAAGCGVCMPNLRSDVCDYVGDAGFVYDSIDDLPEILSRPYPEEMREAGFEQAKKSDINEHKHLLTDLWDKAASGLQLRVDRGHTGLQGVVRRSLGALRRFAR